jgi:hypothetical protein
MKSFAIATFAAVAVAFPHYEVAPVYNATSSSVEVPGYSTPVASSSSKVEYSATTIECSGPTEVPVAPGYTYTYSGSETTTLTFSYPVSPPAGGYTPVPVVPTEVPSVPTEVPEVPSYPTGNGTVPQPPAGTAAPAPPSPTGTGSYTVPSPSAPAPEFPGAAGKSGLSLLAVAGALAAFL